MCSRRDGLDVTHKWTRVAPSLVASQTHREELLANNGTVARRRPLRQQQWDQFKFCCSRVGVVDVGRDARPIQPVLDRFRAPPCPTHQLKVSQQYHLVVYHDVHHLPINYIVCPRRRRRRQQLQYNRRIFIHSRIAYVRRGTVLVSLRLGV